MYIKKMTKPKYVAMQHFGFQAFTHPSHPVFQAIEHGHDSWHPTNHDATLRRPAAALRIMDVDSPSHMLNDGQ